jgi:hypothetical protein
MKGMLVIACVVLSSSGCSLFGPSCVARQERGTVSSLSGSVGAGEVVVHRLAYDARGSQNDLDLLWGGITETDGPRIRFYATRVACAEFLLPAESNAGDCAILGSAGWTPNGSVRTLVVTHGRGNPERLGSPPEYKLWVTSDRFTGYSGTISYFYGPDC